MKEISERLGIEHEDAHTAAGDVRVLRQAYVTLADTYNLSGALL